MEGVRPKRREAVGTQSGLTVPPWTVARQAPLSMGFSRQEHWSGVPFPSPGDLPDPGMEPRSPALRADCLPSAPPGKPPEGGDMCIHIADSFHSAAETDNTVKQLCSNLKRKKKLQKNRSLKKNVRRNIWERHAFIP